MPTMVDAAGRRKVRCPKCTAVLTEPQTQIYECPICLTLLLAKGNPGGKLWEDRAHKSDGDVEDFQQTLEGGSKVAKATLVHESGNILSNVNLSDVGFDGRSRTSQDDQLLSDSDNQSLSGISFAKPKAEPINDLTSAESNALAPDTPPDTPHRGKSPHAGEISSRGGSGQRSPAELDSASHSESEVESSLWSSENANFGEVPDVPSGVSSFEAPSLVAGSSEHLITSTPRLSIGAASNDGAKGLQEESKLELRKPPDAEREERHHPYEVIHEKRQNLESRVRNPNASVITSSGMSVLEQAHNAKDKNDDDSSSAVAQSPQRNVVNSTPKENAITDSKQQKNVEIPRVGGRFGLFDLSVFGIYNEDTYSELMRGKVAQYPKLSDSSRDGKGVQSTVDGEPKLHSREVATESSSREQDPAENCMFENTIAEVQKISDIPESITDGTHGEAGSSGEVPYKDREHGMGARSSGVVGQEVDDGSNVFVGDVGLRVNSSIDSDTLANARYGDHSVIRDPSVQMGSSVDISFGDWQVQQVVKPIQTYVDAGSVHEREMPDVAAGEGSDSSWDDEEGLTFSSALNEESKLKGTSGTEKETEASHSTRTSISRSQAKDLSENPAFPFRTTAMQKFLLQRNEQEGTVQIASQESIKADSRLYEASYVEHYTLPQESNVDETAVQRTSLLMPESNSYDTPNVKEDEDQRALVQEESVDTGARVTEHQHENAASLHSMGTANVNNEAVRPTLFSKEEEDVQGAPSRWDLATSEETASRLLSNRKEKDVQMALAEDSHSRLGFNAVRSPPRNDGGDEADRSGITEVTDLNSQDVGYFNHSIANMVGTAPGKPASLKWKGRSSTQSLSSTEDEGAYGVESEAGSGPDRDSTKKQGFGFPERLGLHERETQVRLGQPTRGQYQPPAHRSWVTHVDADRQKHGSGELAGSSRRSARSRTANARLSSEESFEQVEAGRISNLGAFGRSGLSMAENVSALQGPAVKLNKSMLDQGSNYSYNGTTDYNSDHSSQSQNAAFRLPRPNETYLSNPYGLPAGGSTQAYPLSSHGSIPRAPSQEPGFMHPAHLCASPACSLCMQQQYYMQPPQMIQNLMMHPCAACASQASAAGYHQPLHHGVHSHHMHGSTYSNPSLGQHGSGSLPGRSQRQNRSKIHQSHPLPLTRRRKLYPPLPGKDAPPYVLCKHCNQLLQVPGHLPPTSEPIQKLQCGSCDKISKFSVHLQAGTPLADTSLWATSGGLTVHASDKHLDIDNRRTDTSSMHSSEWISSGGFAMAAQNSYTTARQTSGYGSQQEWVENRMLLQSSASGTSQTENAGLRHHARLMQGGGPEQYRGYGRHVEGEHLHTNTGAYSEGSLSSSPSSPSGSSPGKPPLRSRQPEPVRQRSPGVGERKLRTDSPALTTPIREQGRPSRYSYTGLQGAIHDFHSDSPRNQPIDRLQQASKAGSWRSQPEEADYFGMNAVGSRMEHQRKLPAAPGSPLIEHFPEDAEDVSPMLQPRQSLQNSGNGAMSAPRSPGSGSPLVDSFTQDASTDSGERFHGRERPPLPAPQDASKGSKPFAGLFKRSTKGGQGGHKVLVNGHLISEAAVRKAEELAGPIHSGSYWYDYRAGFWGVLGSPCSGILMPCIEEFHFPLSRDCAGGTTGVLVNGRELHEKDLEVLAKRGMPRVSGKAYRLDIRGSLLDDVTGQPLKGLGKLAPSIEKKGRGFGMSQFTAPP